MKLKGFLLPVIMLVTINYSAAQEVTENTFGKGLINVVSRDSTYSMAFAARFQSLYTSQWDFPEYNSPGAGESNFLIRRARLKFGGFAYTPKLVYKLELGLSNRDLSGESEFTGDAPRMILDAVVKWNFYENFELWAGQTKLPGNRERIISSGNMQTVDRSLVNRYFNIDRDAGVQLHHFFVLGDEFIVREAVALSQGEGRNVTTGNLGGYQFTGRAEVLPFGNFTAYSGSDLRREPTPKLAIGLSYDHNQDAVRTRSNMGRYMFNDTGFFETNINTFFLDAMFKYQGFSFMGEYANRTAEEALAQNSDGTYTGDVVNVGEGINLQAGYLFRSNYEVLGRYTSIALDEEITGVGVENQYTVGISKYIVGHKLKIQTDISLNDYQDDLDNGLMYRLQFDIHF